MPESLGAPLVDLRAEVGHYLGYGRDPDDWDDDQTADVLRCVKGGLRKFYHCGIEWSFLRPSVSRTLASGSRRLRMPSDFGGIEGRITVSLSTSANSYEAMPIVGDVRHLYGASPEATGWPRVACIDPIKENGRQHFDLMVFPEADQAYTLQFQYYLNPEYLTEIQPHPYGGDQHAETILAACLAEAERIKDDANGVNAAEYERLLQVSNMLDARNKPKLIGYNGDRSDRMDRGFERYRWPATVTVEGVSY